MITLDASIFVRRVSPNDPAYAVCQALFDAIKLQQIPLYEPVLVLSEVAGAVSRIYRDPMRGRLYADLLRNLPHATYVPIDEGFGLEAEQCAADYFLRGADATYAVVAQRHRCALVSLDDEHRTRLSRILTVYSPEEALAWITAER